jgi:hypothetical protein
MRRQGGKRTVFSLYVPPNLEWVAGRDALPAMPNYAHFRGTDIAYLVS